MEVSPPFIKVYLKSKTQCLKSAGMRIKSSEYYLSSESSEYYLSSECFEFMIIKLFICSAL